MESWSAEWLSKAILYALIQVATGLAIVRGLVRRYKGWPPASDLDRRLSRGAVVVASAIALGLVARALTHTVAAFGLPDALAWENIRLVAIESRWGASWQIQGYAALALVGASLLTSVSRWGWAAYLCTMFALIGVIPLLGHAAGSPSRHAIHVIHIVGGAIWLGSLAVLVAIRRMRVPPLLSAGNPRPLEALFSPIALTAATLVAASGVALAWIYVGTVDALLSTIYGRLLMLKMACVGAVVACGWLNWRRVRLGAEPAISVMSAEVAFALAVVITTSVLTETEHP